jgi:uncharacterized membrane protein
MTWLKLIVVGFCLSVVASAAECFVWYKLIICNPLSWPQSASLIVLSTLFMIYLLMAINVVILENMLDLYDKKPLRGFSGLWISPQVMFTMMATSVIAFIGYIMIFPGLYLSGRLYFAHMIVLESGCSISEGIKQSWALTADYSRILMAVSLIGLLSTAVGFTLAVFGVTFPIIFYKLVNVYLYRKLSSKK